MREGAWPVFIFLADFTAVKVVTYVDPGKIEPPTVQPNS